MIKSFRIVILLCCLWVMPSYSLPTPDQFVGELRALPWTFNLMTALSWDSNLQREFGPSPFINISDKKSDVFFMTAFKAHFDSDPPIHFHHSQHSWRWLGQLVGVKHGSYNSYDQYYLQSHPSFLFHTRHIIESIRLGYDAKVMMASDFDHRPISTHSHQHQLTSVFDSTIFEPVISWVNAWRFRIEASSGYKIHFDNDANSARVSRIGWRSWLYPIDDFDHSLEGSWTFSKYNTKDQITDDYDSIHLTIGLNHLFHSDVLGMPFFVNESIEYINTSHGGQSTTPVEHIQWMISNTWGAELNNHWYIMAMVTAELAQLKASYQTDSTFEERFRFNLALSKSTQ